jgi:hypothetical protein
MEKTMKFLKTQMKETTGRHWEEEISTTRFLATYYAAWFAGLMVLCVASAARKVRGIA